MAPSKETGADLLASIQRRMKRESMLIEALSWGVSVGALAFAGAVLLGAAALARFLVRLAWGI